MFSNNLKSDLNLFIKCKDNIDYENRDEKEDCCSKTTNLYVQEEYERKELNDFVDF